MSGGEGRDTMPDSMLNRKLGRVRDSQLTKIILVGFLAVLLQIPISMINGTLVERQARSRQAGEDIASKWGREQTILGPFITVPYEREVTQNNESTQGQNKSIVLVEHATFLPEELRIDAKAENLVRHRGIFDVPVYKMNLNLSGRFTKPDFAVFGGLRPSKILWEQARLVLLVSDPRAIANQATVVWNGKEVSFAPGGNELGNGNRGIQAGLADRLENEESFTFNCRLAIQGSSGIHFAPMGRSTEVSLESTWRDPSFQGNWLPTEQNIDNAGFKASWHIASLGRNFSQSWTDRPGAGPMVAALDTFGVNFIQPVDTYCMTERSIKYQMLFLGLTFITLWLFEVLGYARLHAIQYLLIGGGMCLFYLLELSLAEHLGFLVAYLTASASIILLESTYCMAILKSQKRSAVIGGFLVLLYGYLYTLLINQDYALVAGSVGLFLLLGTVMFLTRKIDWFGLSGQQSTAS